MMAAMLPRMHSHVFSASSPGLGCVMKFMIHEMADNKQAATAPPPDEIP
jgi:hypothetical protein